jgi:hypothetical protein
MQRRDIVPKTLDYGCPEGCAMVSQEVTSSNFWAPDPQLPSNVELTNGRPDFETILKGIQVGTMPS